MKKAIYTVITNDYDVLRTPRVRQPECDYICFTDNPLLKSDSWVVVLIEKPSRHLQREIKILAHKYLPEYDMTIYVDANMEIIRNFKAMEISARKHGIALIKHNKRNCLYQEALTVVAINKDKSTFVEPQITAYRAEGMPVNYGMYCSGVMIRFNTPAVNDFCELWWAEVEKHSHRDQLSITYALWKTGLKYDVVPYNYMPLHVRIHKHKQPESIKVFYSTPARSDKNIGKAYNDFMETVPADAWVCLRDGDTMFTTPDWPQHIEAIIKENGNKFDLIGCMTNRLKGAHQLVEGMFECDSISNHLMTANKIRSNSVEAAKGIAGLCLIFKKSLWKKVKFAENSIYFDTVFSNAVIKNGGRIGVAKGLYLLHLYRYGQPDPTKYTKHLTV